MDYLTPKEAALKWHLSLRRVQTLCSEERIQGAIKIGRQWMIPVSAQPPQDGRSVGAKSFVSFENYHFPLLVYTPYYSARSGLSKDELALLDAQLLFLEGRYRESFAACKKLLETATATSVIVGIYYTIYYSGTLSGLALKVSYAIAEIKKICDSECPHREDYRLIYANLRLQLFLDPTALHSIDVMKLSADAITDYKLYIMQEISMSPSQQPPRAINMYCILCRELELSGILPALFCAWAALSSICAHVGDVRGEDYFIGQACRLGAENKFYSLLAKWSSLGFNKYIKELHKYGISDKICKLYKRNGVNYLTVFNALNNMSIFLDMTIEEAELLVLLSYGISNKKIADIKNISEKEVDEQIRAYCKRRSFKNKGELVKFSKSIAHNLGKQKY